jgi:hypothetical protein
MNSDMTALDKKFCAVAAQSPARAVARLGVFFEQQYEQDEVPLLAEINHAALQGGRQLVGNGDYYHAYEIATIIDGHLRNCLRHQEFVPGEVLAQYSIAQNLRAEALRGYVASGDKNAIDMADRIAVDAINEKSLRGTELCTLFLQVEIDINKAKKVKIDSHPQYQANEQDLTERALAAQLLQAEPNLTFSDFLERVPG